MPARIERLFWMVALMLTTMTARADGSFSDFTGTTVEQRLGHGRDSVANRNFFNQYVQAYQRQDWKSCYRPWRELMTRAPFSTYNVTNYAATVHLLLQQLMLSEPDSVERYLYFKDAMEVFDFELQHYRSLNTITDQKHEPLVPGVIQCRRAYYYKELGQHIPAVAYKKETAYKNFVEAFATLRNEQLTMGEEIEAFYLSHYFQACQALFETDRERYYEQFLTDYITCLETCDNMMEKYTKVDEQKWQEYAAARNDIQVYFGRTGAGSPEGLMAYYEPRLTANGKNQRFLDNAVHLMFYNGCIATDVFYDACERAYLLKPNYENCIGMGLFGMDPTHNNGRIDSLSLVDAKRYFDEARRLARNANEHYLASKFTADALARTPQPKLSEGESNADFNTRLGQWRSAMRGATVYYTEALDYAREARVDKQYLADVYYGMTDCYRKAQEFDSARNTLAMVTETYSAYSPERVENMKQAIDRGASVKAQNEAAYRARLQSNSKQLAEYNRRQEALRRKQRAEDAFWRGK